MHSILENVVKNVVNNDVFLIMSSIIRVFFHLCECQVAKVTLILEFQRICEFEETLCLSRQAGCLENHGVSIALCGQLCWFPL